MTTENITSEFFSGVQRAYANINYENFCRILGYNENEDMWQRWQKFCLAMNQIDDEDVAKLINSANEIST